MPIDLFAKDYALKPPNLLEYQMNIKIQNVSGIFMDRNNGSEKPEAFFHEG